MQKKPKSGATHWCVREAAAEASSHEDFKLSTDPFFIEKMGDVVGLYLNPPGNALVLCVDEKRQCQALKRTRPMLPLGLDTLKESPTTTSAPWDHDSVCRPGGSRQILAECKLRDRHQEFLAFLRKIDEAVPQKRDIHLAVDNYGTHKHARVKAWLASRPRWHIHFMPTYCSWLNQVERFFALITDKAIRRGSLVSLKDLVGKIDHLVTRYNRTCKPFIWTATAGSILQN